MKGKQLKKWWKRSAEGKSHFRGLRAFARLSREGREWLLRCKGCMAD